MMRELVFVAAVLAGGCDPSVDFQISGFDSDENKQIQSAMDEWCDRTAGDFCPTMRGSRNTLSLVDGSTFEPDVCGLTTVTDYLVDEKYVVEIRSRRSDPKWQSLLRKSVLHELGHVAGCLTHIGGMVVMAESENDGVDHLTDADVACASR